MSSSRGRKIGIGRGCRSRIRGGPRRHRLNGVGVLMEQLYLLLSKDRWDWHRRSQWPDYWSKRRGWARRSATFPDGDGDGCIRRSECTVVKSGLWWPGCGGRLGIEAH